MVSSLFNSYIMQLLIQRLNFHLKEWIYRNVEGKKVLLLLIGTNLLYGYMLLISIPKVLTFSGDMKIPDMMPTGYEPEYIFRLLGKLGEKGRNTYLFEQIPVDLFYPFFFGITYCLLIAYLLNKLKLLRAEPYYLCLLPLIGGFFDYMENFGIIHMLVDYPTISISIIHTAAFFTVIKSLLSSISFILIIVLLFAVGYLKLSEPRKSHAGIKEEFIKRLIHYPYFYKIRQKGRSILKS